MAAWHGWFPVPGGFLTDFAPALTVGRQDDVPSWSKIALVAQKRGEGKVFLNVSSDNDLQKWRGWLEIPGNGHIVQAPDVSFYRPSLKASPNLAVAGVFSDNSIRIQSYNYSQNAWNSDGWEEIPGNGKTDAGVSMAMGDNGLYIAAKGIGDKQVYVNRFHDGKWNGWKAISTGFQTNVGPRIAQPDHNGGDTSISILAPRASDGQICVAGSFMDNSGLGFGTFEPLPYAATSDATPGGALTMCDDPKFLGFAKGIGDKGVYGLGSNNYGMISNGHTDAGIDAADLSLPTTENSAFVLHNYRNIITAKGIDDHQIYVDYFDGAASLSKTAPQ